VKYTYSEYFKATEPLSTAKRTNSTLESLRMKLYSLQWISF